VQSSAAAAFFIGSDLIPGFEFIDFPRFIGARFMGALFLRGDFRFT
jgi:hypothetical protein